MNADAVVSQYGRLVSSMCWRMTRNEEVAREAAQEVWVAVLEGLDGFRGDSSLSTWIYSITRRVVGRYAQAQRTYSTRFLSGFFEGDEEPLAPAGTDVEHEVWVRSMCDQCLCGIAQCLEPDVRLAYLLRDVADLDYDEVAQVLEVEPEAARQMVSRARRKLRRFLSGHCSLADPARAVSLPHAPPRCRDRPALRISASPSDGRPGAGVQGVRADPPHARLLAGVVTEIPPSSTNVHEGLERRAATDTRSFMDTQQHLRLLQITYAAQLADSVRQYGRAGILDRVTEEKRAERLGAGAAQAAQLGITAPEAAFTTSAELFGCADWTVTEGRRRELRRRAPPGASSAPWSRRRAGPARAASSVSTR